MLVLEIEYLLSMAFAARHDDVSAPDYPPQADRVFAALTAAWGARGERADERHALEWLESQDPPSLIASLAHKRSSHSAFVPPGDDIVPRALPKSGRVALLPAFRRRQERQFPAVHPHHPVVRLVWGSDPPPAEFEALVRLAQDVPYIGHSASLTRCTMKLESDPDLSEAKPVRFRVYPGRLAELERAYHAGTRVQPRTANIASDVATDTSARSVFDRDLIVLAGEEGNVPDVRALALVAKKLRDALMAGFGRRNLTVPAWLSGHDADGSPLQEPHLAVLPLADIGWPHSEGRLLGLALALPATDAREHQQRVAAIGQALWALNADEELSDAPRLDLCWAPGLTWSLRPSAAPTARSLKPSRYARRARIWTSVTPIVLDRFPKGDRTRREEELTAIIARSCEYVGLDRPSKIVVAKHPAPSGAVSAYPSGNGPEWTGWTLPESLRGRLLTHATIEFSEPVSGPVVIGAGRFVGLGLCLPVDERGQR